MKEFKLKGEWATQRVWLNNKELSLPESLKYANHSPTGFNWGYGGSGPSQLALAICLRLFSPQAALYQYQKLKWDVIANLPQSDFEGEFTYNENQI